MNKPLAWTLGALVASAAVWLALSSTAPPRPPGPVTPAIRPATPAPPPPACPNCRPPRRGGASLAGDGDPDIDLLSIPAAHRPHNTGGRDGSGLCVFTSIQYAAWWQNEPRLRDFQAKMKQEPGGGTPGKVDRMIARYGAGTRYVQYEGSDPSIIELALRTGRLPCVTWNDNHMLNCVHLDATRGAIVDNNAPNRVSWYSRQEFLQRWTRGGGGWVFVLLNPPPPPPPRGTPVPAPAPVRQACPDNCNCSEGCDCPEGCPCRQAAPVTEAGYGMEWQYGGAEKYTFGGWESDRAEVESALTDDSVKLHLTTIGPREECERLIADIEADPLLRGRFLVQHYTPDSWEVACGFVTSGRPTVYLQGRDGRVLLRLDAHPGPSALVTALRRADPTYQPASDPQGSPLTLPSLASVKAYLPWLLAGGAGLGLAWLLTRQSGARPEGAAPRQESRQPQPATSSAPDFDALARQLLMRRIEQELVRATAPPPETPR